MQCCELSDKRVDEAVLFMTDFQHLLSTERYDQDQLYK